MAIQKSISVQLKSATDELTASMMGNSQMEYGEYVRLFWPENVARTIHEHEGYVKQTNRSVSKNIPIGQQETFHIDPGVGVIYFYQQSGRPCPSGDQIISAANEASVNKLLGIVQGRLERSIDVARIDNAVDWLMENCKTLMQMRCLFPQTVYLLRKAYQPQLADNVERLPVRRVLTTPVPFNIRQDIKVASSAITRHMLLSSVKEEVGAPADDWISVTLHGVVSMMVRDRDGALQVTLR